MRTGFCRYCRNELHNDNSYYGYCSISCCLDFASELRISMAEAEDIDFREEERERLQDKIAYLQCDYDNVSNEEGDLYQDLDRAEDKINEANDKITHLKDKLKELESLEWENLKKERAREAEYNASVLRKMRNIKENNDDIKEQMEKVMKDNILLKDQNLDLLNSIKEMKGHSERFQQMDLGIELEYDE